MAGRTGITYDQVAAAAGALVAETGNATMNGIRQKIGSGGMGTIHKHFTAWKANRPKAPAPAVEVPENIARAMQAWVLQASTAARATSEESLANALAESVELARACNEFEDRCAELEADVACLATERDRAEATAAARVADVSRLTQEVAHERTVAERARTEGVQAEEKLKAKVEQLTYAKQTIATLTATVEEERQSRVKAEREAAVLLVERNGAKKEAEVERMRIVDLEKRLDVTNEKGEKSQADYEKRLAVERSNAEKAAAEAKTAAAEAKTAAVENADLKARVAEAEKIILLLDRPNGVVK
jgi:colicin import membrane protein